MYTIRISLASTLILLLISSSLPASSITIDTMSLSNEALDSGTASASYYDTAVPALAWISAETGNGASSRVDLDFSELSGTTRLRFDLLHKRVSLPGFPGTHVSSRLHMSFTALQDLTYSLSGFYSMSGVNLISYRTVLTDVSSADELFHGTHVSDKTADEHLTLGGSRGDIESSVLGNLSGTLRAGRSYLLMAESYVQAFNFSEGWIEDSGAEAEGQWTLILNEAATNAVPEPSSLVLLGVGTAFATGCAMRHRRRLSAACSNRGAFCA